MSVTCCQNTRSSSCDGFSANSITSPRTAKSLRKSRVLAADWIADSLTIALPSITFHLLTERNECIYLGNRAKHYEQTQRCRPRNPGPSDHENHRVRAHARLGDQPTAEADLRRRPASQRRLALPCPS